jgi:hypothetical protein
MKSKNYYVYNLDAILRYLTGANNLIEKLAPKQCCSKNPEKDEIIRAVSHLTWDYAGTRNRINEIIEFILSKDFETEEDGSPKYPNYGLADLEESVDNLKRILSKHDSIKSIVSTIHAFVEDKFKNDLNKKLDESNELTILYDDLIYVTHGSTLFGGDLSKIAFTAKKILDMKYADLLDIGEYKIIETEKFIVSIIVYTHELHTNKTHYEDQRSCDITYKVFKITQK